MRRSNTRRAMVRALLLSGIVCISASSVYAGGWNFWPKDKNTGYKKGSPEYECYYGSLPPGSRKKCKHGEAWPPRPRPDVPYQKYWGQYHSAHYWPHPYNLHDQQLVMDQFAIQNAAGWQQSCTLYDFYFDGESNVLTSSGRRQLYWILSNTRGQANQIHVASTTDQSVNEARLAAVQSEVATILGGSEQVPVTLKAVMPLGRPALEVDMYQRLYRENMPAPHIQYTSGPGGGGASGGGGS